MMLFELADRKAIIHAGENRNPPDSGSAWYTHGYMEAAHSQGEPLSLPEWGCLTQATVTPGRVELLTDHAGGWPLYEAESAGGHLVIGADAWAVARKVGLTRLNTAACFDLLTFEYVPGFDTLIEGLKEIPPATRVTLQWDGAHWRRSDETVWELRRVPANAPVSVDAAYENLLQVMRPVAAQRAGADAPLAINLSGGWDSRAIIAAARQCGIDPMVACSYGNPDYPGVKIAEQVANILHVPHRLFPFNDGNFLMKHFHSLCSMIPPTTRFNLADGALAMGENLYGDCNAVMCGHIGDNATKLPCPVDADFKAEADLTAWIARHQRSAFRYDRLEKLTNQQGQTLAQQVNDRLAGTVRTTFAPGSAGLLQWKIRNRARRGVIVELRMLEKFAPVIYTPMLEGSFLEFWMTVPDSQLAGQQLYRRMLASKLFTEAAAPLGDIPRESGTALSPDAPLAGLRDAARNNFHKILRRLAPAAAARQTAADPTALWWQTDPKLRAWAWQQLEKSAFVQDHFNLDELRRLVKSPKPADPSFARIGIWNLLTVAGVEQVLNA